MIVLPVLDLLGSEVVHAVAGRRTEYRPIRSRLTSSSDPLDVAHSLRKITGLSRIYLADLDGILASRPDFSVYCRLMEAGFDLLVDAGIRDIAELQAINTTGDVQIVAGLETCRSPEELRAFVEVSPSLTFSLDLQQGVPRRASDACGWSESPWQIVQQVVQSGVTSIIVLDLSDVGMSTGGSTDELCREIRTEFPELELISGGGVRGRGDLLRFEKMGVDAVLVASALHDGRLDSRDLQQFR